MNTVLGSISEIIVSLFQSLRLSYVAPAFIFWAFNAIFIIPNLPKWLRLALSHTVTPLKLEPLSIITVLSLLGGYFLYVLNIQIIRWFEGYTWKGRPLLGQLEAWKTNQHIAEWKWLRYQNKKISKKRRDLARQANLQGNKDKALRLGYEQYRYTRRLQYDYPSVVPYLPTRLGNVIASFEDYPKRQYSIDAVTLWPRFTPILAALKYNLHLERQKANLDFLLNLCILSLLFALEILIVGFRFKQEKMIWVATSGLVVLFAYSLYVIAIPNALGWGTMVRVAFDLYRYELLAALRGRAPENLVEERDIWGSFSSSFRDVDQYRRDPIIGYSKIFEISQPSTHTAKEESQK
jgi:hypothetical protein